MEKFKCRLILSRRGTGHISQIITGFLMLKKQGIINLEIDCSNSFPFVGIVEVIVNDNIKILYDMADGYQIFNIQKVVDYANKSDFYFKRSYNGEYNKLYEFSSRIFPLGLNYHVTTQGNVLDKPIEENFFQKTKWYVKELLKKNYHQNFYVEKFEDRPRKANSHPLILFTTRTWSGESTNLNPEETKYIDDTRAECIRRLNKEFGNNFIGGFSLREFAKKNYPDCILEDSITERVNFMKLIKEVDICIATMGLFESNGWKLGEYVAASKAIVSEKLRYHVPGNFKPEQNYLEFTNIDECIDKTMKLASNEELLYKIKANNYRYYQECLRPDKLIFNSLIIATE